MTLGPAWKLYVKHPKDGEWIFVGPNLGVGFMFTYESSVKVAVEHYQSLGLETRVEEIQVNYDDR